ncbi:MAG: FtsX-like permease family protein [candidate division Zixibacteria bacterium]|nr:FtsX-like permease family protein [candidate division Zixibacteria bacterium]
MKTKTRRKIDTGYTGRAIAGCALIFTFLILFIIAGYNIIVAADDFRKELTIQVYLEDDLDETRIREIESSMWDITGVSNVKYVDKGDALSILKEEYGEELFTELKDNPLPRSFEIKMDRKYLGWENMERAALEIRPMEGVTDVDYGGDLLRKLDLLREFVITIGLIFAVLISLAATAVVSTSTQLLYFRDREKVEVMAMLGATNFYIARPLIIQGVIVGFLSSVVATLISLGFYMFINESLIGLEFAPPHLLAAVFLWAALWGAYGGYVGFLKGKSMVSLYGN